MSFSSRYCLSSMKHLLLVISLIATLGLSPAQFAVASSPQSSNTVEIGVLAFRSIESTQARWQPLVHYLNQQLPGYDFKINVLFYDQLNQAIANQSIHFILTNPQHFARLNNQYDLKALLTLMPLAEGIPVTEFGGVIFTTTNRTDINHVQDLPAAKIAATYRDSFGGFLMQRWTLFKQGIEANNLYFTGMPHDLVVKAVLNQQADVGFVRTGVLESMIKEGQLSWDDIKIIHPITTSRFPQIHSTELYPEWPLAATQHQDANLNKQISVALLNLTPDHPAAVAASIYGFSPAGNYHSIEAVMLRLNVLPRDDFGWQDIYRNYALSIVLGLIFIGLEWIHYLVPR